MAAVGRASHSLPSLTRQTQWLIRPLQPPPVKTLTCLISDWGLQTFQLLSGGFTSLQFASQNGGRRTNYSTIRCYGILKFKQLLAPTLATPTQKICSEQIQMTVPFRMSKQQLSAAAHCGLRNDDYSNLLLCCHHVALMTRRHAALSECDLHCCDTVI